MGKYLFRYIVILPIKGKKGYVKKSKKKKEAVLYLLFR